MEDEREFVPWGVSYFAPKTGWPPQLWKLFSVARIRNHFAKMKDLGINVVRVFASWNSFVKSENQIDEIGFKKLETMLQVANQNKIKLIITGPDHWEGPPSFTSDTNYITSEVLLKATENYWREMGKRFKDDDRFFAFDLLNEPFVNQDSVFWKEWEPIARVHNDSVGWPYLTYFRRPFGMTDEAFTELEKLRNSFARRWMERLTNAIRSTGTKTLITSGMIQHTFPLAGPSSSGFYLGDVKDFVDYITIHYYPGNINQTAEYRLAIDIASLWASYASSFNRPVVFGEFGWVGGNPQSMISAVSINQPITPQELEAVWCRDLIVNTKTFVSGWLNWGLFDTPEALDISRFTGLINSDGKIKEWGRIFKNLKGLATLKTRKSKIPSDYIDRFGILNNHPDYSEEIQRLVFLRRTMGDLLIRDKH